MRRFAALGEIYNLKDEYAKGRLISLADGLITAFYNVFITGIFYTGFLSMYGMSITDVGVITFIPPIASCFCVFSSAVLEHFPRRKPILIASKIFFYAMYILATTLMPKFVLDPGARLTWFAIILFVAHAVYALFSPGFTTWFYAFYPPDNERRTRYIVFNHIFASITSSVILVLSGLLTDALADSPKQNDLILGLRYFAFALVLLDVGLQACAKEEPHQKDAKVRLREVFTLPFHYRKFLRCMLMMFAWNFIANLNNGLWSYHLLNHMKFSYTLMNTISMLYTVVLLATNGLWQKILRRYSWIKTFGIANLLWFPTEIGFFFLTRERTWMYGTAFSERRAESRVCKRAVYESAGGEFHDAYRVFVDRLQSLRVLRADARNKDQLDRRRYPEHAAGHAGVFGAVYHADARGNDAGDGPYAHVGLEAIYARAGHSRN